MNNPTRIYTVTNRLTGEKRLVESHHPVHAVRVLTKDIFDVHVTPSTELAAMVESGVRVLRQKPAGGTAAPNLTA